MNLSSRAPWYSQDCRRRIEHLSTIAGAIARLYAIRCALDYTHPPDRVTSPEAFAASTRALRLANGAG